MLDFLQPPNHSIMDNPAHDATIERASTALSNTTLTERVSHWVSNNRKTLAIAAGVAVASGAGYYYYTSSRLDASTASLDDLKDGAEKDALSSKKRTKKSKKSKSASTKRSKSPSSLERGTTAAAAPGVASSEEEKSKTLGKATVEDPEGVPFYPSCLLLAGQLNGRIQILCN